jgi:hypothetical protein
MVETGMTASLGEVETIPLLVEAETTLLFQMSQELVMTASVAVMATTAYMPGMEPIRSMVVLVMIRSSQELVMTALLAEQAMIA